MFIDRIKVQLVAGKGGNGIIAWTREKFIPKGGPCGGNGGLGGSIVLRADPQISSLDWYHRRGIIKAQNGGQGGTNLCKGRNGEKLILRVPCGTLVKDTQTGELIVDLTEEGQEFLICQGGIGGRGNESFKSPTHQAPNKCTPGTYGETRDVEFELKIIADVGLVGFPNAGKSSLITALAHTRAKIAAYPFTTLTPNLGYIRYSEGEKLLLADVPGLIRGASQNRGLGFEFLRHIERTKVLVYVLDASGIDGRNPSDDFAILQEELKAYNPELLQKPYLVALNKVDTEESAAHIEEFNKRFQFQDGILHLVSAAGGTGLAEIKLALRRYSH